MKKIDLTELGLSSAQKEEASHYKGLYTAIVSAQYKNMYSIITEAGECRAVVSGKLQYTAADAAVYPAVGDWILADRQDDAGGEAVISHVLHRKSCLMRKAAGTRPERQVIAANIDTVFICMSMNQNFNLRRIERYLSLVWDSMATPVIVLTKSDLHGGFDQNLLELEQIAAGVDIVATSSMTDDGLDGISKYIRSGKTVAFIGSSGVGKSTVINRLLGGEMLKTREIREEDGKGRHATTCRELFLLENGGIVIDTPGMRELQLYDADLAKVFTDIEELAKECRFRNCKHDREPQCAVKLAVEEGRLSAARLANYKKLQRELIFEETKETAGAAQAEKQKFIGMMGSLGAYKTIIKANPKNR